MRLGELVAKELSESVGTMCSGHCPDIAVCEEKRLFCVPVIRAILDEERLSVCRDEEGRDNR